MWRTRTTASDLCWPGPQLAGLWGPGPQLVGRGHLTSGLQLFFVYCQNFSPYCLPCPRRKGQERRTGGATHQISCSQSSCLIPVDLALYSFWRSGSFQKRTLNLGLRITKARRKIEKPECILQNKLNVSHGRTLFYISVCHFLESKARKIFGYTHKSRLVSRVSWEEIKCIERRITELWSDF